MDRAPLTAARLRRRTFAASLGLPWLLPHPAAMGQQREGRCAAPQERVIVWQPWAAHAGLDAAGWQRLALELQRQNRTHVLLQWSSYGEREFWPRGRGGWLAQGFEHWRGTGLKLVMGLHMGEDYYRLLPQPDGVLRAHLAGTRTRSIALARRILARPPALEVQGWYLPQEIDDLHWRSPARRRMLRNHLAAMGDSLASLTPGMAGAPVFASAFFSGASAPEQFAVFLRDLHRGTGVIWLVQDGLGTGRLDEARTADYLGAIARTLPPAGWRGLIEVFDERRAPDGSTRYEPSAPATIARREALWCASTGRQASVVFSLNQSMKGLLPAG